MNGNEGFVRRTRRNGTLVGDGREGDRVCARAARVVHLAIRAGDQDEAMDRVVSRISMSGEARGNLRPEARTIRESMFRRHAELFGKKNLVIRLFERPRLQDGDVRIDAFDVSSGVDVRDLVYDDPHSQRVTDDRRARGHKVYQPAGRTEAFQSAGVPLGFLRNTWPGRDRNRPATCTDSSRQICCESWTSSSARATRSFARSSFQDEPSPLFTSRIPVDYDPVSEDHQWMNSLSFELLTNHLLRSQKPKHRKGGQPRARDGREGPRQNGTP